MHVPWHWYFHPNPATCVPQWLCWHKKRGDQSLSDQGISFHTQLCRSTCKAWLSTWDWRIGKELNGTIEDRSLSEGARKGLNNSVKFNGHFRICQQSVPILKSDATELAHFLSVWPTWAVSLGEQTMVPPRRWRAVLIKVVFWETHCRCLGLLCVDIGGAKWGSKILEDSLFLDQLLYTRAAEMY